jgi:hypothetical protein
MIASATHVKGPIRTQYVEAKAEHPSGRQAGFLAHGSAYSPYLPITPRRDSGCHGFRPRSQRRDRDGISPSSLLNPPQWRTPDPVQSCRTDYLMAASREYAGGFHRPIQTAPRFLGDPLRDATFFLIRFVSHRQSLSMKPTGALIYTSRGLNWCGGVSVSLTFCHDFTYTWTQ